MPLKPPALMVALGLISAPLYAAEPPAAEIVPVAVLLSATAVGASVATSTAQPAAEHAQAAAEHAQAAPIETPYQKHRRLRDELRRKLGPSVHVFN